MSDFLGGVQIILNRIKDCPEDFFGNTRDRDWVALLDEATSDHISTREERDALQKALRNAQREMFNQRVMKKLAIGSDRPLDDDSIHEVLHDSYAQHLAKSMAETKLVLSSAILDEFNDAYKNFHTENQTKSDKQKTKMQQLLDMKKKGGGRYA